jgi:phage baseplate assembly protein W
MTAPDPSVADFLGRGWAFPVTVDGAGRIAMTGADELVRQSIRSILSTSPGERVMRPGFGCGLQDLVFAVNDDATADEVASAVREALALWEPRIDVLDVYAAADPAVAELLLVEINYAVRATNSRFNLVYPFYLQ